MKYKHRNIPENITKDDIIKALSEIDRCGVPPKRKSKNWDLVYNGNNYPPKYSVSIANKYANGRELEYDEFYGGSETKDFLKSLDFTIIQK